VMEKNWRAGEHPQSTRPRRPPPVRPPLLQDHEERGIDALPDGNADDDPHRCRRIGQESVGVAKSDSAKGGTAFSCGVVVIAISVGVMPVAGLPVIGPGGNLELCPREVAKTFDRRRVRCSRRSLSGLCPGAWPETYRFRAVSRSTQSRQRLPSLQANA
jgi:hypothetical protein